MQPKAFKPSNHLPLLPFSLSLLDSFPSPPSIFFSFFIPQFQSPATIPLLLPFAFDHSPTRCNNSARFLDIGRLTTVGFFPLVFSLPLSRGFALSIVSLPRISISINYQCVTAPSDAFFDSDQQSNKSCLQNVGSPGASLRFSVSQHVKASFPDGSSLCSTSPNMVALAFQHPCSSRLTDNSVLLHFFDDFDQFKQQVSNIQ